MLVHCLDYVILLMQIDYFILVIYEFVIVVRIVIFYGQLDLSKKKISLEHKKCFRKSLGLKHIENYNMPPYL